LGTVSSLNLLSIAIIVVYWENNIFITCYICDWCTCHRSKNVNNTTL